MPNKELKKAEGQGRRGDSLLGHLSPGDVVVPWNRVTPEVRDYLAQLLDLERFTAGTEYNLLNPNTGLPEFADGTGGDGLGGNSGMGDAGTGAQSGNTDGGFSTGGFDTGGFNPGFDLSGAVDIGLGLGLSNGTGLGQAVASGLGLGNDLGAVGALPEYGSYAVSVPTLGPPTPPIFDLSKTVDFGNSLGINYGNQLERGVMEGLGLGGPDLGGYDFRGTSLDPVYDRNNPTGFFGNVTEIGGQGGGNSPGGAELLSSNETYSNNLPNNPILQPVVPYNPPLTSPLSPNIPDSLPDQGRYFATLAAGNDALAANMLAPYLSGNRNIYGR